MHVVGLVRFFSRTANAKDRQQKTVTAPIRTKIKKNKEEETITDPVRFHTM